MQNRQSKDQPQQDSGQQNQSDDNKTQTDQGQPSKDKSSEQERTPGQAQESQSHAPQPPEQTSASQMDGDLQLRDDLLPPNEETQTPKTAGSAMDKKKAEALLDNMQENRTRLLQRQIAREKRHGVASGKDW